MRTKMDVEHERGIGFWSKRTIFIPVVFIAGAFMLSGAVMLLWNTMLPGVLGVHTVTFWQAMGILALSKILFGGFRGIHNHDHGRHHHHRLGKDLRGKWMQINPDERKKMTEEMKNEWRRRSGQPEKQE
jgi:hypothetical protein